MGEAKRKRAQAATSDGRILSPGHENHIRQSRLLSARDGYLNAPEGCVDGATRMWAARYIDDVETLLAEIDRLRAQPTTKEQKP